MKYIYRIEMTLSSYCHKVASHDDNRVLQKVPQLMYPPSVNKHNAPIKIKVVVPETN